MRVTLVRTAYSSILYEGEDVSCVLMNAEAEIVAMSAGQDHPLHIVPIVWSMTAVREKFGGDLHPGDLFLHNDPYTGGTHLNDVALMQSMFAGGRLFLFPVVRAHWADVGGMTSGSIWGAVTEIYQEGIRIPPVKVAEGGRVNPALIDVLFTNMRIPRDREGDFRAMVGTCRKAAERVRRWWPATASALWRPASGGCSIAPSGACASGSRAARRYLPLRGLSGSGARALRAARGQGRGDHRRRYHDRRSRGHLAAGGGPLRP